MNCGHIGDERGKTLCAFVRNSSFFLPADLHVTKSLMIIFYFWLFCEWTQRDKGRLTCHQHFGCNSLRRGMPIIIIISLFLSYPFTYYYYYYIRTYTFCEFLVFPFFFLFFFSRFYFSTHVQKSLETCRFLISTERVHHHHHPAHTKEKEKNKMRGTRKKKFYDARLL